MRLVLRVSVLLSYNVSTRFVPKRYVFTFPGCASAQAAI